MGHLYNFIVSSLVIFSSLANGAPTNSQVPGDWFPNCLPNPCAGIVFQHPAYICGDYRLGPVILPEKFPLSVIVATYDRFGDLCPYQFLQKWAPNGSYIYPENGGFQDDTNMNPIEGIVTLVVGQKLDRCGFENGTFLSPFGTSYIERALPPLNLNTQELEYPYNYHVYEVLEPYNITQGPVAAWFQQPGGGTQFVSNVTVESLLAANILKRLEWYEYNHVSDFPANYLPPPPP